MNPQPHEDLVEKHLKQKSVAAHKGFKPKKRKMEVDKEEQKVIDVNVLVNKWLQSQKDICEVLLSIVNKINELDKK